MELLVRLTVKESHRVPYPSQQAALLLRQVAERLEHGECPPIIARHDNGLIATLEVVPEAAPDELRYAQAIGRAIRNAGMVEDDPPDACRCAYTPEVCDTPVGSVLVPRRFKVKGYVRSPDGSGKTYIMAIPKKAFPKEDPK